MRAHIDFFLNKYNRNVLHCLKLEKSVLFQQLPVRWCIKSKVDHLEDAELHLVYLQKLSEEEKRWTDGECAPHKSSLRTQSSRWELTLKEIN